MAEKTGTFNGLTVGLQGTTKKGNPYTIYNVNLIFPTGKEFKLNVPSWVPLFKEIKNVPVGSGIRCEVDEKNNVTDFKIVAPVGAQSAPVPPAPPQPVAPVAPVAPAVVHPEPVAAPVKPHVCKHQPRDERRKALTLALDFYKGQGVSTKERAALEELAFAMAQRVHDFICSDDAKKTKLTVDFENDMYEDPDLEIPPVTDDNIPF